MSLKKSSRTWSENKKKRCSGVQFRSPITGGKHQVVCGSSIPDHWRVTPGRLRGAVAFVARFSHCGFAINRALLRADALLYMVSGVLAKQPCEA